jgi:hypothetical protein
MFSGGADLSGDQEDPDRRLRWRVLSEIRRNPQVGCLFESISHRQRLRVGAEFANQRHVGGIRAECRPIRANLPPHVRSPSGTGIVG